MILRWALLVLSISLLATLADSSILKEQSRFLCIEDPVCMKRFYLHPGSADQEVDEYDSELFAQLFEIMMKEQGIEEEDVPDLDFENQNVRFAWLLVLRSQTFCKDANQVYEIDHGCQCKEGKHCNTDCLHKMTFDTTSMAIAAAVISAMLLWLLHWQGYRMDKLYDYVQRVEKQTQKALDGQQIAVFVMKTRGDATQRRTVQGNAANLRPRRNKLQV